MAWKKKSNLKSGRNLTNTKNTDSIKGEQDFLRRSPYWSYRPVKYEEYPLFADYKEDINQFLENLFKKDLYEGNGDILDNLIGDITRQALYHLDRQRIEHKDIIQSLYVRFQSDKATFESQLERLKEALEENIEEQVIVKNLLGQDEYKERKNEKRKQKEDMDYRQRRSISL